MKTITISNSLKILLPTTALAFSFISTAMAQPKDVKALIDVWNTENGRCRGGAGSDPATDKACERRETLSAAIDQYGWCYGKKNEYGYQNKWHQCTRDSYRPSSK